jgi:hypothetical protein
MDGSRLIAWAIGLVAVAVGIAVVAGETTFAEHVTRFTAALPTVVSDPSAVLAETKHIRMQVVTLVVTLVLLWMKLR